MMVLRGHRSTDWLTGRATRPGFVGMRFSSFVFPSSQLLLLAAAVLTDDAAPSGAISPGQIMNDNKEEPHASIHDMPSIGMGLVCRDGNKCRSVEGSSRAFLNLGGRLVDTAPSYGKGLSQRLFGKALRSTNVLRKDVWIVSKIPAACMGYEATLKCINKTLSDLGTSTLDVALIHRPNNAVIDKSRTIFIDHELRLSTWRALQDARRQGLVRYAGVSNYGKAYLNELMEVGLPMPAVNEIEFNPSVKVLRPEQGDLVSFCQEHGILVVGYNSLGGAAARRDSLKPLAHRYNATPAQLLLRYSLDQGVTVIPTSSSEAHIQENLRSYRFKLSKDDLAEIEASLDLGGKKLHAAGWRNFKDQNDPNLRQGFPCVTTEALIVRLSGAMAKVRSETGSVRKLDMNEWPVGPLCARSETAARRLAGMLKRSTQPFIVLPDFISPDDNERIATELRGHYPAKFCGIHDDGIADNKLDGDMRCENKRACNHWSDACRNFQNSTFLNTFTRAYYARVLPNIAGSWNSDAYATIASLVRGRGANSGGSWHMDENAVRGWLNNTAPVGPLPDLVPQVKCLSYHTDTSSRNAPFTMLIDYETSDMLSSTAPPGFDKKRRRYRYDEKTIQSTAENTKAFILEILAPARSVICFEASSIHHGKTLLNGERYSMTTYFRAPGPAQGFHRPKKFDRQKRSWSNNFFGSFVPTPSTVVGVNREWFCKRSGLKCRVGQESVCLQSGLCTNSNVV